MAWILLSAGEPTLSLLADGSLEWNTPLQDMLGDPHWVEVLWDSAARWLGIRCNYVTGGFPVYSELDEGEYKINSGDMLDAVGISVDENYGAVPARTPEPIVGPEAALYSVEPVWYITIPE